MILPLLAYQSPDAEVLDGAGSGAFPTWLVFIVLSVVAWVFVVRGLKRRMAALDDLPDLPDTQQSLTELAERPPPD